MGNKVEEQREINRHSEELENLRRIKDKDKQEALLKEKIAKYHLEENTEKIRRLVNLDKLQFQKAMKELNVQQRKNDQFDERETKKINNDFINRQKELSNDELEINNNHIENIRKLDDDKEINTIKEINRNMNENNKMRINFEIQKNKLKNDELDITLLRENQKLKIEREADNRTKELNQNYETNMEEIYRKRRKDQQDYILEKERIYKNDQREQEKIKKNYLIQKEKINKNYEYKMKKQNDNFILENKKIEKKAEEEKNRHSEEEYKNKANFKLKLKEMDYKMNLLILKENEKIRKRRKF